MTVLCEELVSPPRFVIAIAVIWCVGVGTCVEASGQGPDIHNIPETSHGYSGLNELTRDTKGRRKEIKLEEEQLNYLQGVMRDFHKEVVALTRERNRTPEAERPSLEEDTANVRQAQREIRLRLMEVMHPEQFKRLQQLVFQKLVHDDLRALLQQPVYAELQLAEELRKSWPRKVEVEGRRLKQELQGTLANLSRFDDGLLLNVLTPEQRARFRSAFGEPIKNRSWLPKLRPPNRSTGIGWSGVRQVLGSPYIRKELEVLDDQMTQLDELFSAIDREQQHLYSTAKRRAIAAQDVKNLTSGAKKELDKLRAAVPEQVGKVLLPHQMKRLQEFVIQAKVYQVAHTPAMSSALHTGLGLTEKQKKELRDRFVAERTRIHDIQEEAIAGAIATVLELLPDMARRRYRILVGRPFAF